MILSDIAHIKPGYPFRRKIVVDPDATTRVIQLRDLNPQGVLNYYRISRAHLTGKKKPDWVETGDLLFVAKGQRNIAVCIAQVLMHTVCAPQFFHIQFKSECCDTVDPMFITWQLNQPPCQNYFLKNSEGSSQTHIRKPILAQAPIILPDIEQQKAITRLYLSTLEEAKIVHDILENRRQQMHIIAAELMASAASE
tara:strand:+ start:3513 stop:4100 length:588 start_codon:yes stop_codon:yes gene_type:complete